jgi:hypothetical protein
VGDAGLARDGEGSSGCGGGGIRPTSGSSSVNRLEGAGSVSPRAKGGTEVLEGQRQESTCASRYKASLRPRIHGGAQPSSNT